VLAVFLVGMILLFARWFIDERNSAAEKKREDELEEKRIEARREQDRRDADANYRLAAVLEKLADNDAKLISIVSRLEAKSDSNDELLRDINDTTQAVSTRAGRIHDDLRGGFVRIAGKIDTARSESATRSEGVLQAVSNQSLQVQRAIHDTEAATQTKIDTQTAEQGLLFDQLIGKLDTIGKSVSEIRSDLKTSTDTAQKNSLELLRLTAIEKQLGEVIEGMATLKRKGDTGQLPAEAVDPLANRNVIHKTGKTDTAQDDTLVVPNTAAPLTAQLDPRTLPDAGAGGA